MSSRVTNLFPCCHKHISDIPFSGLNVQNHLPFFFFSNFMNVNKAGMAWLTGVLFSHRSAEATKDFWKQGSWLHKRYSFLHKFLPIAVTAAGNTQVCYCGNKVWSLSHEITSFTDPVCLPIWKYQYISLKTTISYMLVGNNRGKLLGEETGY